MYIWLSSLIQLWEYDDVNDTADPEHLTPSSFFPPYELQDFSWDDLNTTINLTNHSVTLCGRNSSISFRNGSLCLAVSATRLPSLMPLFHKEIVLEESSFKDFVKSLKNILV